MKHSTIMRHREWVTGAVLPGHAAVAGASEPEPWVRFSGDGRQFVVGAEGVTRFAAVSSAVFDAGAQTQRVGISGYKMLGAVRQSDGTTLFGDAAISEATFASEGSPFQYKLTLKRLKNLRAFTLQGVFHNRSDQDARLQAFDLLDTHGVRLHRGPVYGWCSWYDRTTHIDEAQVMEVTRTIEGNPNVFGKGIRTNHSPILRS